MSNIIDITSFKGAWAIPNIEKDSESFENNYIAVYEPEILKMLLGFDLYRQFKTGLDEATPAEKWTNLKDGAVYDVVIGDITYKVEWEGLEKLITSYVYFSYVRDNFNQLTTLGVISSTAENATQIDPNYKMVWAWNEAEKRSGNYKHVATGESLTYLSVENTLFNFVFSHLTDYTNWIYMPIEPMNVLGI